MPDREIRISGTLFTEEFFFTFFWNTAVDSGVPCSLRRARERRERQSSSYPSRHEIEEKILQFTSRGWISSRGSSASVATPAPYRPPSPPAPGRWRLSHYDAGIAKIAPLKTVPLQIFVLKYLTNSLLARCLQEYGSFRRKQNMGQTSKDGLQHLTEG